MLNNASMEGEKSLKDSEKSLREDKEVSRMARKMVQRPTNAAGERNLRAIHLRHLMAAYCG